VSLEAEVGGARLRLHPERAAFVVDEGALLVADAHIGKAMAFRRLGVPVPDGTTREALDRLDRLLAATGARRIVFLGDLLHSAAARAAGTLQAVARWRERHAALELVLVRGNHDRQAGDPPPAWRMHVVDEPWRLGPLALAHHPAPAGGAYVIAGHLHPCVVLGGRAHDRLRLPCFRFADAVGVLPAFGAFTGMHAVRPAEGERLFVVADGAVRPLRRGPREHSGAVAGGALR
jgi:DNA ligase-associated metallophosphoesterase